MKKIVFSCFSMIIVPVFLLSAVSCREKKEATVKEVSSVPLDTAKQKAILEKIISLLPPERPASGRVSFLDSSFVDWAERTGELPPDFDRMPSIPFLPDPLVLDEGGNNTPITTMAQWKEKREWMKKQLEYYITGTYPPKPENLESKILSEKKDGETLVQMIGLTFGPESKAKLTIELMIPPGKGPFPVFLTQWNHREWAMVAVRRGYIGCVYAGADSNDDTEAYSEIWAGEYDFTRLMRRSFGAYRAIDYLYTLPFVDKDKIGITGHSRNGKLSLMAAAFDERITACIPSSGGTGAEVPWRYTSHNYDIEDIALLGCGQPSWLHPRLRFFIGREQKLPIDQNSFMALIAPRGLMLSTAISEGASNPWGIEEAYRTTHKVYKFLGAENNIAIRSRYGLHSVSAKDMEEYIDFFDYIFKRSDHKPANRLFYNYSFDGWKEISGEKLNAESYPEVQSDIQNVTSVADWEVKKNDIQNHIRWGLGDEPAGVYNPGPGKFSLAGRGEANFGTYLERPMRIQGTGVMSVSPYNGFGDQLFGYLHYPVDDKGEMKGDNIPVVIWLHEYDYAKGINSYHQVESFVRSVVQQGYAVFLYDMIGFGNRIEEGTRFYDRYPHWSKLGKMVTDVRGAVDALSNFDFLDSTKIFVAGYSLGANVGLYAAAMDDRIDGAISVAGFTPMRTNTLARGTEGIMALSHLHGLLPRLGFFVGNESRIPYDYDGVLASIAPRPVLVIAPLMDKDAHPGDIEKCIAQVKGVYSLYNKADNIELFTPDDYNRFAPDMREKIYDWLGRMNPVAEQKKRMK